jgi:CubicO group peptidase (beta-lactamase class C family)
MLRYRIIPILTAILEISSLFLLSGCLEEGSLHRDFKTFAPLDIADGWVISTPSAEGIDSLGLVQVYKDVYNHKNSWSLRSFLVFRNGRLIAESYLKDEADRTRYNAVWSCTKQVTGIMTGIALDEGYITSINDSIKDYLGPELANHADKRNITINSC